MKYLILILAVLAFDAQAAGGEWFITQPFNGQMYSKKKRPPDTFELPFENGDYLDPHTLVVLNGRLVVDTGKASERAAAVALERANIAAKEKVVTDRRARIRAIDQANSPAELKAILKDLIVEQGLL